MRCCLTLVAIASLWLAGCEAQSVPIAVPPPSATSGPAADSTTTDDPALEPALGDPAALPAAADPTIAGPAPALTTGDTPEAATDTATTTTAAEAASEAAKPVAVADGAATLSPDNTKIQFVGTHSPPKQPDPRTGGFGKFSGKAQVDAGKLKSVSVDIDTTSLFTPIQKLTDHLKSPDFFEVNEFPTAKFESTKIEQADDGQATITGNLTLHGVTKEITFPATVQAGDGGLTLKSDFDIDRTQFGMTFGEGSVEKKVSLSVVVGEKTAAK